MSLLEKSHIPQYDKYNAMESLTMSEILKFSKDFLQSLKIQGLIQGNISKEEAENITTKLLDTLQSSAIADLTTIEKRAYQIPLGNSCVRVKALNSNDVNSYVVNFYQIDAPSIENACYVEFLVNILEEPVSTKIEKIFLFAFQFLSFAFFSFSTN